MQTAEFNHNDFSNTAEADKALMVRFFYKNVQNKLESEAKGVPVFKEKTYIEIRIAGQRDAQACRPATHADKQRFAAHFDAFEKRVAPPTEGMPLLEWGLISRTQAEELSFLSIKTVEQLASVKDSNLQKIMGGNKLREKAQNWLEKSELEGIDKEKEEMREELAVLKAQMAEILKGRQTGKTELNDDLAATTSGAVGSSSSSSSDDLVSELDDIAPKKRSRRSKT